MKLKALALLALLGVSLYSCHAAKVQPTVSIADIKTKLSKQLPGITNIDQINPTVIAGLYEVVAGRKIFYVSKEGKYLIIGNLVNIDSHNSITEERMAAVNKIDFTKLPFDLAFKQVNGTGEHKLVVFSDPDCPYCKVFVQQIAPQLQNVTIYTLLFPLSIHPSALTHSKQIWCSNNRLKVFNAWMTQGTPLPVLPINCDTTGLDKIMTNATDVVEIEGTPTLIFADGSIVSGNMPVDKLQQKLDNTKQVN